MIKIFGFMFKAIMITMLHSNHVYYSEDESVDKNL